MASTLHKYYDILGISPGARMPQVKAAYRRKAKLLHPDVNKSPDASAKFILLNEAYEYFESAIGGKKFYEVKAPTAASAYRTGRKDTARNKREEARRRAEESARIRDELFRKSKFYWGIVGVHAFMDYMILAGVVAVYLIVLLFGTWYQGTPGLLAGVASILVTLPHAVTGIKNFRKHRVR